MRKGTTPSFVFELPLQMDQISAAKVTFAVGDKIILEKHLQDCAYAENTITVKLTQEETFLFECNATIEMQLRVLTVNEDALSSDVFTIFAHQCLDDEVLK